MDSVDSQGRVFRHPARPQKGPKVRERKRPPGTYNYKLKEHVPDILRRFKEGESVYALAKAYGVWYQAIYGLLQRHPSNPLANRRKYAKKGISVDRYGRKPSKSSDSSGV